MATESDYEWYKTINDGTLEQGDIVEGCKVIMPSKDHYNALLGDEETELPLSYQELNCAVLSQSCDLENDKIDFVILCPLISLSDLIKNVEYYKSSDAREQLRQGNQPSYHLLNKVKINGKEDFYCVTFHHIFSVPKEYLKALVDGKDRIRMLSPYKENLAQSFARYFMRVGLPLNIDKDEIKKYKGECDG